MKTRTGQRCLPSPWGKQGLPTFSLMTTIGFIAASLAGVTLTHAQTGSPSKGQQIVESRCFACHSLDTHRVGPALGTVLGRVAGAVAAFNYSPALRKARHVWTRERLLAWLADPESLVPGQTMGYRVDAASDREDVVAYLATLVAPVQKQPASSP